ncbi:hypothetical protein MY4824_006305 [Beauveria thailandica]
MSPKLLASKQTYSTTAGDTCDSIALAKLVSAASLYYLNPSMLNCSSVPAGLQLCLLDKCETHMVKNKDEDYVASGIDHDTSWTNIAWRTPGNGEAGDKGGSRDGYTKSVVPVLEGGKVAEGTTKNCGRYVQAGSGVECPRMLAKRAVPMDLFLGKVGECDDKLIPETRYCLNPLYGWNQEDTAKAKTKE